MGSNGSVEVSVLVPVLNEAAVIRASADAMLGQRLDRDFELLFVDGGSDDGSRAILDELAAADPRIRVLDNPARAIPNALNVGLRAARGRYVARMDAHTFYPPTYLANGVERLRKGGVDWVAGPQIPRGDGRWSERVALALETGLASIGSKRWGTESGNGQDGEVELDTGVFTGVWERSTLEEHGGWAEGWPINQDSELAARVIAAGGRIVQIPEMGAGYVPRNSLRSLARQYYRYGLYREKTARHHPISLRRSHLLAPGVVLMAAGSVVAPRPLRALARLGLAGYGAALVAVSVRAARSAPAGDAAALPAVFATMHGAWGAGFLVGAVRFGPPVEAVATALGVSGRRT
jgi:glycosyltransferase involved in cell wall biosynthesis